MAGTIEEIKQVVIDCLRKIYPRGRTGGGMGITCFKGKTGADGQRLIGYGDGDKLTEALDELVIEGTIVSHSDVGYGEPVFHYKTDIQAPVVGRMGEIKLAITECLCRIYPQDLIRVGIARNCFKNRHGHNLVGANGIPLAADMASEEIKSALDSLVKEGKIDAREQQRDGEQRLHYAAKEGNIDSSSHQSMFHRTKAREQTLSVNVLSSGNIDFTIPQREDEHSEFKQTFSVPMTGGKSNDVKMEVAITVTAFANTEGGRLFIGVRDDGSVAGLKSDLKQYKNLDKLELAIRDYLKSVLGRPTTNIKFKFVKEDYLVISVPKFARGDWFYVKGDFYVRDGNRSMNLNSKETAEYQKTH